MKRDSTHKCRITLIVILFISALQNCYAQVTIVGPSCVMAGTTYSYKISGTWTNNSTIQLCVSGGLISGTKDSCTPNGSPIALLNILWNNIPGAGKINVSSSVGNNSINVNIVSPLQPGSIDTSVKIQSIGYNQTASQINCSAATGGSCTPSYVYEWQVSPNNIFWKPVTAASDLYIKIPSSLKETLYIRRKVIEIASGSMAYSNSAIVFVAPDLTGHN